jgi:hypothetical protein
MALRVARHIWVKLEEGSEQSEVNAIKADMINKMKPFVGDGTETSSKSVVTGSAAPSPPATGSAAPSPPATSSEPKPETRIRTRIRTSDVTLEDVPVPATSSSSTPAKAGKKEKKNQSKGDSGYLRKLVEASYEVHEVLPEDAPAGSDAYSKVARQTVTVQGRTYDDWRMSFKGIQVQVTKKACLGNDDCAQRIGRLLYVRAETGAPKEEVIAYRNELYAQVRRRVLGEDAPPPEMGGGRKHKSSAEGKANEESQNVESRTEEKGEEEAEHNKSDASSSASDSDSSSSQNRPKDSKEDSEQELAVPKEEEKVPRYAGNRAVAKLAVRTGLRCWKDFSLVCPQPNGSHVKSA